METKRKKARGEEKSVLEEYEVEKNHVDSVPLSSANT
jgi:hypothetical protein